ncbi:MAG: J domain-containing protein [Alphaproteobacteria bacterium]
MKDPYDVLGLTKTATAEDIKRSYRRLARTWHPDGNPDPGAEERFKQISAAYQILSDPVQRGRFDRGEIDADGHERGAFRQGQGHGRTSGGPRSARGARGGFDFGFDGNIDPEDLFSDLFGRRRTKPGPSPRRRGADSNYELQVTFEEAVLGTTKRVTLTTGKTLDVRIAAGTEDGRKLRLKGQGLAGGGGGEPGDALIEIKVAPHAFFVRKGDDIHLEAPMTLKEAVLGAKITVPTVDGRVSVSVPRGSNTGTVLRLKGKGVEVDGRRGDQLVKLTVVLPEKMDLQLETFVKHWRPADEADPRERAGLS